MNKLLPNLNKTIDKSFISEHMIFDCHYVIKMLEDIEKNAAVKGKCFGRRYFIQ